MNEKVFIFIPYNFLNNIKYNENGDHILIQNPYQRMVYCFNNMTDEIKNIKFYQNFKMFIYRLKYLNYKIPLQKPYFDKYKNTVKIEENDWRSFYDQTLLNLVSIMYKEDFEIGFENLYKEIFQYKIEKFNTNYLNNLIWKHLLYDNKLKLDIDTFTISNFYRMDSSHRCLFNVIYYLKNGDIIGVIYYSVGRQSKCRLIQLGFYDLEYRKGKKRGMFNMRYFDDYFICDCYTKNGLKVYKFDLGFKEWTDFKVDFEKPIGDNFYLKDRNEICFLDKVLKNKQSKMGIRGNKLFNWKKFSWGFINYGRYGYMRIILINKDNGLTRISTEDIVFPHNEILKERGEFENQRCYEIKRYKNLYLIYICINDEFNYVYKIDEQFIENELNKLLC